MKYFLFFTLLFLLETPSFARDGFPDEAQIQEYKAKHSKQKPVVQEDDIIGEAFFQETPQESKRVNTKVFGSVKKISVTGQGTAPSFAQSPAQAYLLAKRAAMNDAYRLLAEKIKGVHIEGKDTIQNMAVKESYIRTKVNAMIRNATLVETTYKDGLCEVEMEVNIDKNNFK